MADQDSTPAGNGNPKDEDETKKTPSVDGQPSEEAVDEELEETFPASDPPANY
ncbi:hypothetical protein [uncultured Corynebacterium sp.]|uniref:hypothetical protein n=1 Tax=uncultured Corynebacterium sp. TaxID=159447 RepID=UPI0025FF10F8|nr:hypothetical protein [uncultured Corynebacterium sp.]